MSAWQIAVGIATPVLALAGTMVMAVLSRRTGRDTTSVSLLTEMREWTEDRLAERDQRIDHLEMDVRELRAELDALARKYRSAIAYIRRIVQQLRLHVPMEEIESPPPEIQIDL